ncbi:MAG: orotate phosphoribosyltransferase, partial [Chloroflexota bacterium]
MSIQDEVLRAFEEAGAIKRGHFLLSSGLHSDEYWEKFEVL